MDEVHWYTKVIMPIWVKESPRGSLISGYIEGTTDCSMSLKKWDKLMITITENTVP